MWTPTNGEKVLAKTLDQTLSGFLKGGSDNTE